MSDRSEPRFLFPGDPPVFPDPETAGPDGLLAIGGDLGPERLAAAYRGGIFPWFDVDLPPMWWSPDPRCVIRPGSLHVPRRLGRTLRQARFELSWNRAFRMVMEACAGLRADGTWIVPAMIDAYLELHRRGQAHSLEVWSDGGLVGGLYGVQVGGLFAAESKFHRRTDMSKVALVAAVHSLFAAGIRLFDVQFRTEHLGRLGAVEIPRADYLRELRAVVDLRVDIGRLTPTLPPGG
jgi:leucyl/phenylalanyl-tRNA--protein transferase